MEKIKITIAGVEYTIKQSFRALMLFEEMTKKSINNMGESVADVLKLFYCILKGANVATWKHTFEEFLDLIDDTPEAFTTFTNYLQEQAKSVTETTEQAEKKSTQI